jgi:hypothetical protein
MRLRRPDDLRLDAALSAVGAEDALGRAVDPRLGLGRQRVLGERHALLLKPVGLTVGEVDLDLGLAVPGHLLAEFVPVLSGLEQQGHLLLGDLGAEDLDLVPLGLAGGASGLRPGDGSEARSAEQKRADGEDRSRSVSHEPPSQWLATAASHCQAHDSS